MSREDDARVAKILGWAFDADNKVWWRGSVWVTHLPAFTTDPAADYKVLEWARESDVARVFHNHLRIILDGEGRALYGHYSGATCYQPGDYSRALLALKEKGLI